MKKLILMGARNFINMPVGTMYIPIWKDSQSDCIDLIEKFMTNPLELLDFPEMEIYGDNSGSMAFTQNKEDRNIFFYDANVVGDASPETTLYLVFSDGCLPETIEFPNDDYEDPNWEEGHFTLTKERIFEIREMFMGNFVNLDNAKNHHNDWARNYLDEEIKKSQLSEKILNLCMEYSLEE